MKSDAEIVEAVLSGTKKEYAVLVERHENAVRASAARITGSLDAAEEAAQEAFVIAYEKLATLRKRSSFGPWVLKIARREAIRILKRNSKLRPLGEGDSLRTASDNPRLDAETSLILDAVERLPRHEKRVVMLRYFSGQTVQDIAALTGRPVGTVTKQLSRAHARLRKMLREEG